MAKPIQGGKVAKPTHGAKRWQSQHNVAEPKQGGKVAKQTQGAKRWQSQYKVRKVKGCS